MAKKKTKQTKVSKKVTKEVPQEAPKKKKKKHTGLKVFAILMTIFVVFPIAFVFIAFFDTSTKKVSNNEIHYENLVAETFYNSVGNLVDTGSLGFTINEEMIDGIMTSACDKINQKQFIPKMYCTIRGNHYTFFVDLQASFFKTRVLLQTTLKDDEENVLIFRINQLVIGRLPIPVNWVTGIAGNFIKDDMLNNAFEQAGFRIKCHLAKAQLTYSKEDFREDVAKYVEKLASNNEYLKLVFDVLGTCTGDDDLIKAQYNNGVTAAIDLSALQFPKEEQYNPLLTFNKDQLDKHRASIVTWLNNGWLKEGEVANMFSYLIRGYKLSSTTIQTDFIDKIDGEFLEELDKYTGGSKTYQGTICNDSDQDFYTYCTTGVDKEDIKITPVIPKTLAEPFTLTLDGGSLNQYLARKMTDAIGKTIPITYTDSNNKWNFEYIFVDNLFVKFDGPKDNPEMIMYLSLNISGYPICLKLVNDNIMVENAKGDSFGDITFNIKNINFGTIQLEGTELLTTLLKMIPSENESFTYHEKADGHEFGYFSIGLDKYITIDETEIKEKVIEYLSIRNNYSTSADNNNFILSAPKQP